MEFAKDIQGPFRINYNDFDEPLTFPVGPLAGQSSHLFSKISGPSTR